MNSLAPLAVSAGPAEATAPAPMRLRCAAVVAEAPDVKTFRFLPDDGRRVDYRPGQFVTLRLPADAGALARTYTLSSSPSRPHALSVTVKAQPDSQGSRWLLDHLAEGDVLDAHGPAGDFTLAPGQRTPLLLLSAGSGATPMLSMTRWLYDTAEPFDLVYVHFARSPADLLFLDELQLMARQAPGLALRFVVQQGGHGWQGGTGRLSGELLALLCPDFAQRDVFCCGPASFMAAARAVIEAACGSLAHYREESFQPPAEPAPLPGGTLPSEEAAELCFARSGVTARCAPGTTILEAAREAGLAIPYACRMGLCGTCKVRKVSGETEMRDNGGIAASEIAQGYLLACCTTATGRVEIDL